jgi:hypothetical protein
MTLDNGILVFLLYNAFLAHTGENQGAVLLQVFTLYRLEEGACLGFFIADNATSCNTIVCYILNYHYPTLSSIEKGDLEQLYRCRYVSHILNLAARSFLKGEDALEDTPDNAEVSLEVLRR